MDIKLALWFFFGIDYPNRPDTRSNGQVHMDNIARQKRHTQYVVEFYRRHKHVDLETLHAFQIEVKLADEEVTANPNAQNTETYNRLFRDYKNALRYYKGE